LIIWGGGVCDTTHALRISSTVDFKFARPSRLKRNRTISGVPAGPARHVLFTIIILYVHRFRRHVQYRSLFCYYFPRTNHPRSNVSIVATLQLASVGNNYTTVRAYFRGGCGSRRTMLSKSRGKPIYGRVTCNMLTIRISHFKIIYIIVTDPNDSTRRVWRRCDVYTIYAYLLQYLSVLRVS